MHWSPACTLARTYHCVRPVACDSRLYAVPRHGSGVVGHPLLVPGNRQAGVRGRYTVQTENVNDQGLPPLTAGAVWEGGGSNLACQSRALVPLPENQKHTRTGLFCGISAV